MASDLSQLDINETTTRLIIHMLPNRYLSTVNLSKEKISFPYPKRS